MSIFRLLKSVRNSVADVVASIVCSSPFLEPVFIGTGRFLVRLPVLHTLYRRSTDTLVGKLQCADRQHRRSCIYGVDIVFDVSDFTFGPWYFKGNVFEPLTTAFIIEHLAPGDTFVD